MQENTRSRRSFLNEVAQTASGVVLADTALPKTPSVDSLPRSHGTSEIPPLSPEEFSDSMRELLGRAGTSIATLNIQGLESENMPFKNYNLRGFLKGLEFITKPIAEKNMGGSITYKDIDTLTVQFNPSLENQALYRVHANPDNPDHVYSALFLFGRAESTETAIHHGVAMSPHATLNWGHWENQDIVFTPVVEDACAQIITAHVLKYLAYHEQTDLDVSEKYINDIIRQIQTGWNRHIPRGIDKQIFHALLPDMYERALEGYDPSYTSIVLRAHYGSVIAAQMLPESAIGEPHSRIIDDTINLIKTAKDPDTSLSKNSVAYSIAQGIHRKHLFDPLRGPFAEQMNTDQLYTLVMADGSGNTHTNIDTGRKGPALETTSVWKSPDGSINFYPMLGMRNGYNSTFSSYPVYEGDQAKVPVSFTWYTPGKDPERDMWGYMVIYDDALPAGEPIPGSTVSFSMDTEIPLFEHRPSEGLSESDERPVVGRQRVSKSYSAAFNKPVTRSLPVDSHMRPVRFGSEIIDFLQSTRKHTSEKNTTVKIGRVDGGSRFSHGDGQKTISRREIFGRLNPLRQKDK